MKKSINKKVIKAAAVFLAVSIILFTTLSLFYAGGIKDSLSAAGKASLNEIKDGRESNLMNYAIFKGEKLVSGEGRSAFYISASLDIGDGRTLLVYGSYPFYAFLIAFCALYILLGAIIAKIVSEKISRSSAREISARLEELVEKGDLNEEGEYYEELIPVVELIKKREEQERIEDNDSSEKHRREFTANVSHELKTPLTTISGTAEILKSGLVKPEDIPHFAENIYNETQRMITLVNDIIKLSQLDENEIPLEREPIDLFDIANDNIGWLKDEAEKNDITFIQQGEHVHIKGVRQIIDEMVHNLCDNAIKYNKIGGTVTVTTFSKDGKGCISIKDTGIGIPQKHQAHVFERFYRVDKSHSREIGGTGLGLSIVKHGASFHNANVALISKENEGTEIILSFDLL